MMLCHNSDDENLLTTCMTNVHVTPGGSDQVCFPPGCPQFMSTASCHIKVAGTIAPCLIMAN